MKVAFTGSSSTGKTTLARRLERRADFSVRFGQVVGEDARSLLRAMGHMSMDEMSRDELREFQRRYFDRKATKESLLQSFLVDRSFVDVAAYWLVRDSHDLPSPERDGLVASCEKLAKGYDLHVYFPMGVVPFQSDGYRSEDSTFHRRIDAKIAELLSLWKLRTIRLAGRTPEEREDELMLAVADLGAH